jgi:hypothetical protein
MRKKILLSLTVLSVIVNSLYGQVKYQNEGYGFEAEVPEDWHVYAEIKDDPVNKRSIIDWGLPKVYSELEKTSIENAVSITAYKRAEFNDVEDLIKFEYERVQSILISKEQIDSLPHVSYLVNTEMKGLKYQTKQVFVLKNDIGYVLTYTATPGTYDKNLSKFDSFVNKLNWFEPKEEQQSVNSNPLRVDGLYIAKTNEISVSNSKVEIYTYIRFYKDGTVCTQSVNSYDPESVMKWFGKHGRFERKGRYKLDGSEIEFTVTNEESQDQFLEGAKTDKYTGKISDGGKLFLNFEYDKGEQRNFWFDFAQVN